MLSFYITVILFVTGVFSSTPIVKDENKTPVIGVLSQEISPLLEQSYPGQYKSYIAASYVKFVEGGGARVVPIWINKDRRYYENVMTKVNGVLFPGGVSFNLSSGYGDAGSRIVEIAKAMNDKGSYMPIWGTCLGLELLLYLDAGAENRVQCRSMSQPLALDFKKDFRYSRLFGSAPERVIKDLANEPITANFHTLCVTEQKMAEFGTDKRWKALSLNKDRNGLEYVSSIESKRYPFYGLQFHPDKVLYEWVPDKCNLPHTPNAVEAAQYFAKFLVSEARKSPNRYDPKELKSDLIYNYPTTYTGATGSAFEECYLFKEPPRKKTWSGVFIRDPRPYVFSKSKDEIRCEDIY